MGFDIYRLEASCAENRIVTAWVVESEALQRRTYILTYYDCHYGCYQNIE